ncbi:MAG TPA: diacylglycerol kinase family protein [Solirubrobacteraceae bacterium]|nr:diacylglycerol kinase family protein [Solirubrobacteraceae bacterium]
MRIALAANRASGGGLDPEPLVAALREAGAEVTVGGCESAELETLAASKPDRMAVAGGDGTVAAVAAVAGRIGAPLAVIPTGTANDFARAHGLPEDPVAAARLAAAGTRVEPQELGLLADGRPFVNVASAGLASHAARRADALKTVLGPLAYGVGALHAALSERPAAVTVRVDGKTAFDGGCWQVIVAITGAFGGGSGVREADPGDGRLDVVVIPASSRLALARRAWGLRSQTIAQQAAVPHHIGTLVEVDLPAGTELDVDGELRDGGLARVTVERAAFALVVG